MASRTSAPNGGRSGTAGTGDDDDGMPFSQAMHQTAAYDCGGGSCNGFETWQPDRLDGRRHGKVTAGGVGGRRGGDWRLASGCRVGGLAMRA